MSSVPSVKAYLRHWWELNRNRSDTVVVSVDGFSLQVNRKVFSPDPKETFSTSLILEALPDRLDGQRVLDIGTGAGILAFACARRRADLVVGTDKHDYVLRNARENLRTLKAVDKSLREVRFVKGDLLAFEGAPAFAKRGSRFDLILANLPIYSAETTPLQSRLIGDVQDFLATGGEVLVTYAEFGRHADAIREECERSQLDWVCASKHALGVRWDLWRGKRRAHQLRLVNPA